MKLVQWFKDRGFDNVQSGIEQLKSELGIKIKEYPDTGLYVFNYCQIESPKTDPVVMECRGVILRDNFDIVCRPLERFFNLGEALNITSNFDITESVVYEKLDGSLCKVYHDGFSWQVATRGTAYAESENYTGEVFQDLMLKAFNCSGIEEFNYILNKSYIPEHYTLIFEYTSPNNRVVTPYKEDTMYLLAIVDNEFGADYTGTKLYNTIFETLSTKLNIKLPKTFSFTSDSDMKGFVNSLGGLQEGVVAHDIKNNIRVKVKADQYVAVHRLRGDSVPTPRRIMRLVVTNETDEYLAYFPEERERFTPYIQEYETLKYLILLAWEETEHIQDQKEFALAVKNKFFSFILFQAKRDNADPLHILSNLDINKKVKLFESYYTDSGCILAA